MLPSLSARLDPPPSARPFLSRPLLACSPRGRHLEPVLRAWTPAPAFHPALFPNDRACLSRVCNGRLALVLFIKALIGELPKSICPGVFPVAMIVVTLLSLLLPFRSGANLVHTIWRVLTAPAHHVSLFSSSNSLSPPLTLSHPLSHSLTPSHPLSPSLTPSHPLSPSLTLSHPLSPSLTLCHSLSPPLTLSHPLSRSLTFSPPSRLTSSQSLSATCSPPSSSRYRTLRTPAVTLARASSSCRTSSRARAT